MRKITIAGNGLTKRKRHSNSYIAMALDRVLGRRGRPPNLYGALALRARIVEIARKITTAAPTIKKIGA